MATAGHSTMPTMACMLRVSFVAHAAAAAHIEMPALAASTAAGFCRRMLNEYLAPSHINAIARGATGIMNRGPSSMAIIRRQNNKK